MPMPLVWIVYRLKNHVFFQEPVAVMAGCAIEHVILSLPTPVPCPSKYH
jgi:hypothetical protein